MNMKFTYLSFLTIVHLGLVVLLQGCAIGHGEFPSIVYSSPDTFGRGEDALMISISTYNLKGIRDPRGLARTLEALDFVDIWVFQEVNKAIEGQPDNIAFREFDPPDSLLSILALENWNAFYVPMNRVRKGNEWEGLAIVSKHGILEKGIWPLRATQPKQRGALYSVISLDAENRVLVVNTDHEVDIFSVTPTDRKQQVLDLSTNIRNFHYADIPVALLSDFNTVGVPLMPWRMNAREEVAALKNSLRAIGICSLPKLTEPCDT
jgi:endonuclease/exonuclease/phosphatase family metal-dependent hydrolase